MKPAFASIRLTDNETFYWSIISLARTVSQGTPATTCASREILREGLMKPLGLSINALARDLRWCTATAFGIVDVVTRTRALKLPGIAGVFESLARQARDGHWPQEDYLQEVLSAELGSRHESVMRQRLRDARFPQVKTRHP